MEYIAAGVFLVFLGCIGLLSSEQRKFKMTYYTIPAKKIQIDKKINYLGRFVMLSDLHNHEYGKRNERLLKAIDNAKPEFIVIAGDMLTAKPGYSLKPAIELMEKLSEKYPVYYGNGNHEYRLRLYPDKYGDMYDRYKNKLEELGVHHLENQHVSVKLKDENLRIYGLEIDRKYYQRFKTAEMDDDYIKSVLGEKTKDVTILIAHNPDFFKQYSSWGADLTLAGHIHGGMVRIPGIGGVVSPQLKLFPKYDAGIFKNNGHHMILGRGLGMHTIPIRIFNRAEVVVVDLVTVGRD